MSARSSSTRPRSIKRRGRLSVDTTQDRAIAPALATPEVDPSGHPWSVFARRLTTTGRPTHLPDADDLQAIAVALRAPCVFVVSPQQGSLRRLKNPCKPCGPSRRASSRGDISPSLIPKATRHDYDS